MIARARRAIPYALVLLCGFSASELLHLGSEAATRAELRRLADRLGEQGAPRGPSGASAPGEASCSAAAEVNRLRAELQAGQLAVGVPAAAASPVAPPPGEATQGPGGERAQEAEAALQRGRVIVSEALRRGTWTEEDAAAFAPLIRSLGPAGHEELVGQLLPAINEGRVRVETAGPPFSFF